MNAKLFVADNYQWMTGFIISILILAVLLMKKYLAIITLLKEQVVANKKLSAQVKEFQTDHTDALEHLNAANERKLKSQHIAHTKMKDEQRLRHNKTMELMATGHLKELLKLKSEYARDLAGIKEAHKKTVEGLKGGYTCAIEEHAKVSEEIKQQYHVAIEERQYQFESIKMQYENFFRLLDKFEKDNYVRTKETIYPILNEFQRNYVQALTYNKKKNAETAITVVNKRLQRLALNAKQELFKIKEEMTAIRLVANMACLQKLDELSGIYDVYMENLNKMMTEFIPLALAQKVDQILENDHYVDEAARAISRIKEALIDLTREEVRAA